MKFVIRSNDTTNEFVGIVTADTHAAAAARAARRYYHLGRRGGATRVTGDPNASGVFRTTTPTENGISCGAAFHVAVLDAALRRWLIISGVRL